MPCEKEEDCPECVEQGRSGFKFHYDAQCCDCGWSWLRITRKAIRGDLYAHLKEGHYEWTL